MSDKRRLGMEISKSSPMTASDSLKHLHATSMHMLKTLGKSLPKESLLVKTYLQFEKSISHNHSIAICISVI